MYAIIEEGGRQFKVTSGDTILIDREVGENAKSIKLDRVLLVAGLHAEMEEAGIFPEAEPLEDVVKRLGWG